MHDKIILDRIDKGHSPQTFLMTLSLSNYCAHDASAFGQVGRDESGFGLDGCDGLALVAGVELDEDPLELLGILAEGRPAKTIVVAVAAVSGLICKVGRRVVRGLVAGLNDLRDHKTLGLSLASALTLTLGRNRYKKCQGNDE
jgi:hypothetical protein